MNINLPIFVLNCFSLFLSRLFSFWMGVIRWVCYNHLLLSEHCFIFCDSMDSLFRNRKDSMLIGLLKLILNNPISIFYVKSEFGFLTSEYRDRSVVFCIQGWGNATLVFILFLLFLYRGLAMMSWKTV